MPSIPHSRRVAAVLAVASAISACRSPVAQVPPTRPDAPPATIGPATTQMASDAGPATAATAATQRPPTAAIPVHEVAFEGLALQIPESLASTVEPSLVAAAPPGRDFAPSGVRFELKGYPLAGRAEPAEMWVYRNPLMDGAPFSSIENYFRPIFSIMRDQALDPGIVPTIPPLSTERLLQARLRYLGVAGGRSRAVRFLTMVGDAPRPVNNAELLYVVQGMFSDVGVFYSFRAPIAVDDPSVSADANGTPDGLDNFPAYVEDTAERIKALPPEAFTPNLDHLDAAIKSLDVSWTAPSPEDVQAALERAEASAQAPSATPSPAVP